MGISSLTKDKSRIRSYYQLLGSLLLNKTVISKSMVLLLLGVTKVFKTRISLICHHRNIMEQLGLNKTPMEKILAQ